MGIVVVFFFVSKVCKTLPVFKTFCSIKTTEIVFENICQDINASYDKLLTCDVDSAGPHEVHLVPHEDEGAV